MDETCTTPMCGEKVPKFEPREDTQKNFLAWLVSLNGSGNTIFKCIIVFFCLVTFLAIFIGLTFIVRNNNKVI